MSEPLEPSPPSAWSRLVAFLAGDQSKAEGFPAYDDIPVEPWIQDSHSDPSISAYAVEVTQRAAESVDGAVGSLQDKAASVANFAMPLIPVAIAVLGFALGDLPHPAAVIAATLFLIVVGLLVLAAVRGFLGSGARLAGGVNPRRLASAEKDLGSLRAREADAWLLATELGLRMIQRRNQDLFAARRAITWAFVVAVIATVPFVIAETESGDESSSKVVVTLERGAEAKSGGWRITIVPPPRDQVKESAAP